MIVVDTHVWIWFLDNPDLLSPQAKQLLNKAYDNKNIFISSISTWEIYMLEQKGRIKFKTDAANFIKSSERLGSLHFISVDNEIARISVQLADYSNPDPADRIIIATANMLGFPLITKDQKIRDFKGVKTIW